MIGRDSFTQYYAPLLVNAYDVVDRIVVNAYFGIGCSPGGFRTWWEQLHGTVENLDDTHLMRMAGRFSRRVRGWAKKHDIPVIDCKEGARKHRIAEQYIPTGPDFRGIFAVMVARMPAPVWKALRFESGGFHLKRKDPMPFVNHYFFHIMDGDWGARHHRHLRAPAVPSDGHAQRPRIHSLSRAAGPDHIYQGGKLLHRSL